MGVTRVFLGINACGVNVERLFDFQSVRDGWRLNGSL